MVFFSNEFHTPYGWKNMLQKWEEKFLCNPWSSQRYSKHTNSCCIAEHSSSNNLNKYYGMPDIYDQELHEETVGGVGGTALRISLTASRKLFQATMCSGTFTFMLLLEYLKGRIRIWTFSNFRGQKRKSKALSSKSRDPQALSAHDLNYFMSQCAGWKVLSWWKVPPPTSRLSKWKWEKSKQSDTQFQL